MHVGASRDALHAPEFGVNRFTHLSRVRRAAIGHRVQEETYVVVAGWGSAKLDDEVLELSIWDVPPVAPEVVRAFEAGREGLDFIGIGGRKPKGGNTERSRTSLTDRPSTCGLRRLSQHTAFATALGASEGL